LSDPTDPRDQGATRVEVVHVELDRADDVVARARARLTTAERARADRFRRPQDARAWTLAHAALRDVLGRRLGRAPETLVFEVGAHGKPFLSGGGLEFNLSHSGRWALIALGATPLGVDVERLGRVAASEGVVEHAFGERERALLQVVVEAERDVVATRLWVRKEALLKALGTGLSGGLQSVDVSERALEPGRIDVVAEAAPWSLVDLDVDGRHVAALAVSPDVTELGTGLWDPVSRAVVAR